MLKVAVIAVLVATTFVAAPAFADGIPKFGKTCIGKALTAYNICVSSNGKIVSSTYFYRGNLPTKGRHTGCTATKTSISCTGGSYQTSRGNGAMNPVVFKLKDGKPTSMAWH